MKADEARALVAQHGVDILSRVDTLMPTIYKAIAAEAKAGRSSVEDHKLSIAIGRTQVPGVVWNGIWGRLRKDGYKIVHHDDPDPGHPGSRGSYTEVLW